jgi:hypothetical protein
MQYEADVLATFGPALTTDGGRVALRPDEAPGANQT